MRVLPSRRRCAGRRVHDLVLQDHDGGAFGHSRRPSQPRGWLWTSPECVFDRTLDHVVERPHHRPQPLHQLARAEQRRTRMRGDDRTPMARIGKPMRAKCRATAVGQHEQVLDVEVQAIATTRGRGCRDEGKAVFTPLAARSPSLTPAATASRPCAGETLQPASRDNLAHRQARHPGRIVPARGRAPLQRPRSGVSAGSSGRARISGCRPTGAPVSRVRTAVQRMGVERVDLAPFVTRRLPAEVAAIHVVADPVHLLALRVLERRDQLERLQEALPEVLAA